MSNGDRNYNHMVVRIESIGDLKVLCFTDSGEPAVYADTPPAELLCAQYRERFPHYRFGVLSYVVL